MSTQHRPRISNAEVLEGRYADAVFFPSTPGSNVEHDGLDSARRFPLKGAEVILCEAKRELSPDKAMQAGAAPPRR